MWKVYDPSHIEVFDEPYEAHSKTFNSLCRECEYIGIFIGRSGNMRTFAVWINN